MMKTAIIIFFFMSLVFSILIFSLPDSPESENKDYESEVDHYESEVVDPLVEKNRELRDREIQLLNFINSEESIESMKKEETYCQSMISNPEVSRIGNRAVTLNGKWAAGMVVDGEFFPVLYFRSQKSAKRCAPELEIRKFNMKDGIWKN